MKFFFVRHGETDYNKIGKWQGQLDIPLNDMGREQAKIMEEKLAKISFQKIYASPLKRAKETADIINEKKLYPMEILEGLQEIDFGSWEGHSMEEVMKKEPARWQRFETTEDFSENGMESYVALQQRVLSTMELMSENHKTGDHILVVTHGAWLMALLCYVHEKSLLERRSFPVKNTSCIILEQLEVDKNRYREIETDIFL